MRSQTVPGTAEADLAVCLLVPIDDGHERVGPDLSVLLEQIARDVRVFVVENRASEVPSPGGPIADNVSIWQRPWGRHFGATVNEVLGQMRRSDLVLVSPGVMVGPEWLERLRAAAYSLPNVAGAMVLSGPWSLGTGEGAQRGRAAVPSPAKVVMAAQRVSAASRRAYPFVPTMSGPCVYIRRSALDAVGDLDPSASTIEDALAEFSKRAVSMGLVHVCADDVLVYSYDGMNGTHGRTVGEVATAPGGLSDNDHRASSTPGDELDRDAYLSPSTARVLVEAAVRGLALAIDGTRLASETMGTQIVLFESARALSRHPEIADLSVVLHAATPVVVVEALAQCGAKILFTRGPGHQWEGKHHFDVVYRPCQVTRVKELRWLLGMGSRLVVCQLDCIAYNNPAYFANWARWAIYRRANELAFRLADGITFLSQASREQSARSGLVPAHASAVVYPGTDHMVAQVRPTAPPGLPDKAHDLFLCLGASYKHKNRVDAIRIWVAARAEGWRGSLVLAGPTPPEGSSLADEDELLSKYPELSGEVWQLGTISEAEKEWLYQRSVLVLYPTLSEGFGLVPFEAARHGVPCLATRSSALDEVLPADLTTIDLGDLAGAARAAVRIATDRSLAQAMCQRLNSRASEFTWDRAADQLVSFFWDVVSRPSGAASGLDELALLAEVEAGPRSGPSYFELFQAPLEHAVQLVVERPALRRALAPPGSASYRLGKSLTRFMERHQR